MRFFPCRPCRTPRRCSCPWLLLLSRCGSFFTFLRVICFVLYCIVLYCLRRPHFFQQRDEGIPRLRTRVTFALGGKSDQKRRSNLRFENPLTPRTQGFAVLRPTWTRQGENHSKCGIDLLLSPLPLKTQNVDLRSGAFQSKSGSAQRNTSIQHFGRTRARRQTPEGNPKTMGFWRRSFPHFFRC